MRIGASPDGSNAVVSLQSLSPADFNAVPKLKQQALQNWYMSNHPNWAIYDAPTDDGTGGPPGGLPVGTAPPASMPPPMPVGPGGPGMAPGPGMPGGPGGSPLMAQMGGAPGMVPAGMAPGPAGGMPVMAGAPGMAPGFGGAEMYGGGAMQYGAPDGSAMQYVPAAAGMGGGMGIPGMPMQGQHRASNSSPFALMQGGAPAPQQQQQPQGVPGVPASGSTGNLSAQTMPQQQQGPPNATGGPGGPQALPGHVLQGGPTASGGSVGSAGRSAFAVDMMMHNIADAFPKFPGQAPQQQAAAPGQQPPGGAGAPQQGPAGEFGWLGSCGLRPVAPAALVYGEGDARCPVTVACQPRGLAHTVSDLPPLPASGLRAQTATQAPRPAARPWAALPVPRMAPVATTPRALARSCTRAGWARWASPAWRCSKRRS